MSSNFSISGEWGNNILILYVALMIAKQDEPHAKCNLFIFWVCNSSQSLGFLLE